MPAGPQCIAELSVHKAAISSIAISSNSDRIAIGDGSGQVCEIYYLFLNLIPLSLLFYSVAYRFDHRSPSRLM